MKTEEKLCVWQKRKKKVVCSAYSKHKDHFLVNKKLIQEIKLDPARLHQYFKM